MVYVLFEYASISVMPQTRYIHEITRIFTDEISFGSSGWNLIETIRRGYDVCMDKAVTQSKFIHPFNLAHGSGLRASLPIPSLISIHMDAALP